MEVYLFTSHITDIDNIFFLYIYICHRHILMISKNDARTIFDMQDYNVWVSLFFSQFLSSTDSSWIHYLWQISLIVFTSFVINTGEGNLGSAVLFVVVVLNFGIR